MKSKEEVALAWIIVALVVLPLVVLYPPVILVGIVGYALRILYTHYRRV
jgi:preprotein translocase subunit Sss1